MADDDGFLSPIDCLMPWTYIRQIFCFQSTDPLIPRQLREGLRLTLLDIPYLARGIVKDHRGVASLSGSAQTLDDLFRSRDLTTGLDYSALKAKHFPPSALTVPDVVPQETNAPFPDPAPVFRAVLSRVKGGYLLCVAVQHCTTDITGFGSLLRIWASHCQEQPPIAEVKFSWLDRRALSGSVEPPSSIPELLHLREGSTRHRPRLDPATFDMVIFKFSSDSLRKLKVGASEHLTFRDVEWLSTSDVLIALLWSAVIYAETDVETTTQAVSSETSTIGLPVNFRSQLEPPLPKEYLGAAFGMTSATTLRKDLTSCAASGSLATLASIATAIRKAISRVGNDSIRRSIAFLQAWEDTNTVQLGPPHDGISIVSWATEGVYDLNWGERAGRIDSVRVQKWPGKRYPIILPRLPDGGLEVLMSLEEPIMRNLREGLLMTSYSSVVCVS
ncbi:Transferase family-domain-containing protein [Pleurostoma richardsiae]|uniref:Transferase family-domain-containing protein n=1 Tax=Pleurostoma richardsiae TaxID=41990 RepID=A0AA38RFL9_9PEZI|nr:Transferase family-domain-containing protein [Pleurostoma richardsiae]